MIESEKIKKIYDSFCANKLAHAFLIETNDEEKCAQDVTTLIKMINCPQVYQPNCDKCPNCLQLDNNNYPEHIVVNSNGQPIKKETIIELRRRFSFKPIFGNYESYIIMSCDRLNAHSANALLKFLEEPAEKIVGFLITKQKEMVIPTIKSRCQVVKAVYKPKENLEDEKFKELFENHLQLITTEQILFYGDLLEAGLNKRVELESYFTYIFNRFENDIKKDDMFEYNRKLMLIAKKSIEMVKNNVNIEMCLDYFTIEMRKLNA